MLRAGQLIMSSMFFHASQLVNNYQIRTGLVLQFASFKFWLEIFFYPEFRILTFASLIAEGDTTICNGDPLLSGFKMVPLKYGLNTRCIVE